MKTFSRRNIQFLLYEVLNAEALTQYDYFNAHDRETFDMTLDTATEISEKIMWAHYVDSDRKPPELENGQVKVHEGVLAFIKAYAESGLLSATFPVEWEGQQLPKTVNAAVEYICMCGHNSFIMFTDLAVGCSNLILNFGTDEQKRQFVLPLLSGKWGGTMCLTEPQAGSSLSDISTMALPQSDGTYKINGQKIFISAGDQDYAENIIHLVLARIEGAPKGTKGISLFIVPKNKIEIPPLGRSAARDRGLNDVQSIGIFHKMGQKATPALHLGFGENNECVGYLLGEAHKGLPQMFQMMNGARLGVGLTGISIASAAYNASLQYAHERTQGRRLNAKGAQNEPTAILNHPDVRRMLLTQKAVVEGGMAFIFQCYYYMDMLKVSQTPEDKTKYDALLELLTPVAKTYGAEMGIVSVNQGLQVLGGYGYTEDFPLEQMARDVRIMSIYEGTTGIQSQALLGRQVTRNNGLGLKLWQEEVQKDVAESADYEIFVPYCTAITEKLLRFEAVTKHLLEIAGQGDAEVFMADATLYMEFFGILNVAWQWLRMAQVAQKALLTQNVSEDDRVFYGSKIQTMQFFYKYELSKTHYLADCLLNTEVLTVVGESEIII
jgi:alkylation response protein AidB-like acyl-CoA dehydrogenase